ncbi:MAG: hypothetical protein PUF08_02115 [Clostridiales bacterium]|nr:hypothetical protein [Clostridiales bacterium]
MRKRDYTRVCECTQTCKMGDTSPKFERKSFRLCVCVNEAILCVCE